MNWDLLLENITNPALLFFFLGLFAVQLKSDLEVPENSSKFISIYLLFSIGFKGGQELSHSHLGLEILWALLFGILLALLVPFYTYFILRRKLSVENSAAISAAYGSVSAVTFITAVSYLDAHNIEFGGHMVAVMALMEAPSIIVGLLLFSTFTKRNDVEIKSSGVIKHALTNGSVILILGSLAIGFAANEEQAQGIKPFTNDIFKGFLAIFLLDMGITSGKKIGSFLRKGWFTLLFAVTIPLLNGCLVAYLSGFVSSAVGDRFIFAILAASASYIAVPAAMRMAIPKANPGLYIPMALAVTFPFNITLGMPIYYYLVQ